MVLPPLPLIHLLLSRETGAAVPGAKVERQKNAAVVAAMRVLFIGILPRMAVVSNGDHHIHAVRPL